MTSHALERSSPDTQKQTQEIYFYFFFFYINLLCSKTTGYSVLRVCLWIPKGVDLCIHKFSAFLQQFYTFSIKAYPAKRFFRLFSLFVRHLNNL